MTKRARRIMQEDHEANKDAYIAMGEIDLPDGGGCIELAECLSERRNNDD